MPVPELSIIVPVYKVEDYLSACIDSILSQTFTDFELILVDDGSPDRSGAICDDYARRDSRIRVIHQVNAGVSAARNAGLDVARGAFITFVDSDDMLGTPTTLEENMQIFCTKPGVDVVQFPHQLDNGQIQPQKGLNTFIKSTYELIQASQLNGTVYTMPWGRIIKRSIWGEIRFPVEMEVCEDLWALLDLFKKSPQYYISATGIYHYRQRVCSAWSKMSSKKWEDRLSAVIKQYGIICELGKNELQTLPYYFVALKYLSIAYFEDKNVNTKPFVKYLSSHEPSWRLLLMIRRGQDKLKLYVIKSIGLRCYLWVHKYFKLLLLSVLKR